MYAAGDSPIVVSSPKVLIGGRVVRAAGLGGAEIRAPQQPPKGLTPFNANTGISVPLLRVRPNTSDDAPRDYLPGTEGRRDV